MQWLFSQLCNSKFINFSPFDYLDGLVLDVLLNSKFNILYFRLDIREPVENYLLDFFLQGGTPCDKEKNSFLCQTLVFVLKGRSWYNLGAVAER